MERGTLYQLINLIHRSKAPKKASEDFLEAVIVSYILAAVMHYLGMSSFDSMPSTSIVSHDLWMEDDAERRRVLADVLHHVVEQYVDLATKFASPQPSPRDSAGRAYEYTCEVLSLGLLYLDFKEKGMGTVFCLHGSISYYFSRRPTGKTMPLKRLHC